MLSVFLSCIAPVISIGFSIAAGPELQQCPCTAGMRTFPVPIRTSCTLSSSLAFGAVFKSKKSFFWLSESSWICVTIHCSEELRGSKLPRWLSSRTKGQLEWPRDSSRCGQRPCTSTPAPPASQTLSLQQILLCPSVILMPLQHHFVPNSLRMQDSCCVYLPPEPLSNSSWIWQREGDTHGWQFLTSRK